MTLEPNHCNLEEYEQQRASDWALEESSQAAVKSALVGGDSRALGGLPWLKHKEAKAWRCILVWRNQICALEFVMVGECPVLYHGGSRQPWGRLVVQLLLTHLESGRSHWSVDSWHEEGHQTSHSLWCYAEMFPFLNGKPSISKWQNKQLVL